MEKQVSAGARGCPKVPPRQTLGSSGAPRKLRSHLGRMWVLALAHGSSTPFSLALENPSHGELGVRPPPPRQAATATAVPQVPGL